MTSAIFVALPLVTAPTPERLYGAIFSDFRLNAFIGNGNNAVTWTWLFGADDQRAPTIKIVDLKCQPYRAAQRCLFDLHRLPDPETVETEADELTCSAVLVIDKKEEWSVLYKPPSRGRGHSRTSMTCKAPT